eukprot:scaffold28357_cov63-Phaeocystis_antarctica.AAC.1
MFDNDFLPVHGGAAAPALHTDNVCRIHLPDTGGTPGSDARRPDVIVVTRAGDCRAVCASGYIDCLGLHYAKPKGEPVSHRDFVTGVLGH